MTSYQIRQSFIMYLLEDAFGESPYHSEEGKRYPEINIDEEENNNQKCNIQ